MPGTVYVVCRTAFHTVWSRNTDANLTYEGVSTDLASAEDYARRLDRQFKLTESAVETNPLRDHRLDELSSLTERALRDRLLDGC